MTCGIIKYVSIFLLIVMLIAFSGCSDSDESPVSAPPGQESVYPDDHSDDVTPGEPEDVDIPLGQHTIDDLIELLKRKAPENGPIDTPVESWSILAPGVGGLGSPVCSMCVDQMHLYNDLALFDGTLTRDLLDQYYKKGQVGLHGDTTFQRIARSFYPDGAWNDLVAEFQDRGYDEPITYTPPDNLTARINWDAHHVPHVVGDKAEDVTFGVGYATVYSNMFELLLLRSIGKSGVLQMGLSLEKFNLADPIGFFEQFHKSNFLNYTRSEMLDGLDPAVCTDQLGPLCQEMLSTMVSYSEGINRAMKRRFPVFGVFDTLSIPWPQWEVVDSIAPGLGIMGVFGDPGGDQLSNLNRLRKLDATYSRERAIEIFDDYKFRNSPVAPTTTTLDESFPSPVYSDNTNELDVDRIVDPDSIAWIDSPETGPAALLNVEKPSASNWVIVSGSKSASGHPILVGGPQMGYIQPNIFFEFDARTADESFQMTGVSLPGLYIAAFAGNAHNGVWTPTAAQGKTTDIFVEKLCSPTGEAPVPPDSNHYLHNGECKPMNMRHNEGLPHTVHGPVFDRATVQGEPVAIVKYSYQSRRMGQGVFPFYKIAKGHVRTAQEFIDAMEVFTLATNFAYINESEIAYINTGLYPVRAAGSQSDFPTWGTGEWDWQGIISMAQRPHAINPESGYLASWNNQAATDFYSKDGGFQRVQLLDRLVRPEPVFDLGSLAEVSHVASLQDGYAIALVPILRKYTDGHPGVEENQLSAMLEALSTWTIEKQAKRLDLNDDGKMDDAGPAIMDEIMVSLKAALEVHLPLPLGGYNFPNPMGSAYQDATSSLVLMFLTRALNNETDSLLTCGDGTYEDCQSLVIDALVNAQETLVETFDSAMPADWCKQAEKIILSGDKDKGWHWQNRPTYQQAATVQ